jgi:hypothetical protein
MERRDLLKMIAAATGAAFIGSNVFAYEVLPAVKLSGTGFSKSDVGFLNEIGETIIPRTDTPGAKDANVGHIMAIMVADCYTGLEQKIFKDGMKTLNSQCKDTFGNDFILLSKEEKTILLSALDNESKVYNKNKNADANPHYFILMKQLVLFCFFTSEVGSTKVLRYLAVPGRYDGEYPYKPGDKAWAT